MGEKPYENDKGFGGETMLLERKACLLPTFYFCSSSPKVPCHSDAEILGREFPYENGVGIEESL